MLDIVLYAAGMFVGGAWIGYRVGRAVGYVETRRAVRALGGVAEEIIRASGRS